MTQRILVVDDDGDVRELVCRMLEQDGYEAVPADGGRQALERLNLLAPDLVITDVVMPDMDGFEVLLKLRLLAPETEALVMSGGGRVAPEIYLETARRLGARAVLRKPFTRAEMLEAVHQILGPRAIIHPPMQE
ncbi:MAG: response regulator [Humidesulfovibrio sp.]|uniref:response regulator n=1 Tax=Humidesulfovibrio sp. TaxID=2910988 RepID=UPI0027359EFE|nr:response regulator [Humidesulfovibrio sp.]MDP2848394.1 response regulator [Humidesulfovibrio sp.]